MKNHNRKILALAGVVGAILVTSGCSGHAVVPTSYKTYNAKDGSFQIQYPAEWEADGGGASGYAWAKFTSGDAEITVDANAVGSLIGDIAKIGTNVHGGIQSDDQEKAPVAAVHEHERESFEEDGSVKEQEPTLVKTGFIDARRSEYAGSRTFGGSIRGYRVTALSSQKRIRVVCQCSESQWEALKPVFDKVIESAKLGRP